MADSLQTRGDGRLAVYAINGGHAGGRRHPEPADSLRDPFELDRHRIIECTAFRRLEAKTQVFAPGFHDHFRTRLTHSLEVASIARTLARALGLNELLTEAIALAHDLGHPPFGHAGESALNEAMAGHDGIGLHFKVDAGWQSQFNLAPAEGHEITVETKGITLLFDVASAQRVAGNQSGGLVARGARFSRGVAGVGGNRRVKDSRTRTSRRRLTSITLSKYLCAAGPNLPSTQTN